MEHVTVTRNDTAGDQWPRRPSEVRMIRRLNGAATPTGRVELGLDGTVAEVYEARSVTS